MNYDVKFLTGSDEHGQKIEKKAKELNYDYFGTTLTVSPYKNCDLINEIGLKKMWLTSDSGVDRHKAYSLLLKDIRENNIGRITFEKYESIE